MSTHVALRAVLPAGSHIGQHVVSPAVCSTALNALRPIWFNAWSKAERTIEPTVGMRVVGPASAHVGRPVGDPARNQAGIAIGRMA